MQDGIQVFSLERTKPRIPKITSKCFVSHVPHFYSNASKLKQSTSQWFWHIWSLTFGFLLLPVTLRILQDIHLRLPALLETITVRKLEFINRQIMGLLLWYMRLSLSCSVTYLPHQSRNRTIFHLDEMALKASSLQCSKKLLKWFFLASFCWFEKKKKKKDCTTSQGLHVVTIATVHLSQNY